MIKKTVHKETGDGISALKYPLATEKAVGIIEKQNTITYIVDFRSSKTDIARQFEARFGVKVAKVRTVNKPNNEKKVFIKLAKGYSAAEIAMKLKLV